MMHAVDVIAEIRARLEATGGVRELQHLAGMSAEELDLMVRLERGWGPAVHRIHTPIKTWGFHRVIHLIPPGSPQGCPSSPPQAERGSVGHMANDIDVLRKAG